MGSMQEPDSENHCQAVRGSKGLEPPSGREEQDWLYF